MANEKGFYDMHQPDSKTQPAKVKERPSSTHGDGHDFNTKGKVTRTEGSDYHDVSRKNSGLHGNFSEKDAQNDHLMERGKKGQVIRSFSGTQEESRLHTYNAGGTAYNGRPIDEVYKPATSNSIPPPCQVVRPMMEKPECTVKGPSQKDTTKKLK